MTQFIVRRILVTIPVLLGIVFIVFALARLVPGDPCRAVLGEHATDELCNEFIHRYGLDQPIPVQFVSYLGQLASGDLGVSIKHSEPVTQLLTERLPTTIELTIMAMIFAVAVGVPLGLISAYRHNSKADVGTMVFANFGVSIPVFVLGLLLAYLFAIVLKDTPFALPPSGRLSSGVDVVPPGRGLGPAGLDRPAPRDPRLRVGPVHLQLVHHRTVGRHRRRLPAPHPAGHRTRHDPARDHRPDHALQPARGPWSRLRPDGTRQGPR